MQKYNLFTFTTSVATIGFSRTAYSVIEDSRSVSITLSLENGILEREVIVTLSSINDTAMCEFQFETTEIHYSS